MRRIMTAICKGLVWFGQPWKPVDMSVDGILFAQDGTTYVDTTTTVNPYNPTRIPEAPAGYRFVPFRDEVTGWPGYQLVKDVG